MLFNARDGFFTTHPGTYWLQGRISANGIGDVLSPEVAIEVREPARAERSTWEWLDAHKEEYGRLVQVPWEAKLSDEFIAGCRSLCDTSDSVYVQYLALFLSRWYGEGPGKDHAEAARYAEIAQARASSEMMRNLASKALVRFARSAAAAAEEKATEPTPERPVEPQVRKEVESAFQGFIAALGAGDIERCLQLTSEDYRGWTRAKQREELQEDIDKLADVRQRGLPADLSARVLSVMGNGEDVIVMAIVSARAGSDPPEENQVRCRLRKYGDAWLLQDWTRVSKSQ
jgi:hypothetical protein